MSEKLNKHIGFHHVTESLQQQLAALTRERDEAVKRAEAAEENLELTRQRDSAGRLALHGVLKLNDEFDYTWSTLLLNSGIIVKERDELKARCENAEKALVLVRGECEAWRNWNVQDELGDDGDKEHMWSTLYVYKNAVDCSNALAEPEVKHGNAK